MRALVILCVIAVFGLVAACFEPLEPDPPVLGPRPVPTSSTPSRRTPPPSEPIDDVIECPERLPLTEADLDKELGFKPAKASADACSAADMATLAANFKDTGIKTYFDLGKDLPDTCFQCVFSRDTDATWGPIVGTAENNGATGFVNWGACTSVRFGEACGRATQYEAFCVNLACNECSTTATERETCSRRALTTGMCREFASTKEAACPDAGAACPGDLLEGVAVVCGPNDADGGG